MTTECQYVIQAEFFLVGKDDGSLKEVMVECAERAAEGSLIKKVVRFLDEDGSLTTLVRALADREKKEEQLFCAVATSRGLNRLVQRFRLWRFEREESIPREQCVCIVAQYLQKAIQSSRDVAIEKSNHTFRLARKDEMHELVETAFHAKSVWIFVFELNSLVSDTNTIVTYAM